MLANFSFRTIVEYLPLFGQGLVASLARPGGNITGFTFVDFEMIGKCLELLKDMAPGVVRAGLMFHPDLAPYFHAYLREIGAIPARLAVEVTATPVRGASEIEAVIAKLGPQGGLIVAPDPFTVVNRETIMQSVGRHRLPAIYTLRQDVVEGAGVKVDGRTWPIGGHEHFR